VPRHDTKEAGRIESAQAGGTEAPQTPGGGR
jgi:hypothetical protein